MFFSYQGYGDVLIAPCVIAVIVILAIVILIAIVMMHARKQAPKRPSPHLDGFTNPQDDRLMGTRSRVYSCPFCFAQISYAKEEAGGEFRCPACRLISHAPTDA